MSQKGIHWFPGHMVRAWRQLYERLPLVDVVIECRDARAPIATELPPLTLKDKQSHIILFNKVDLSDHKVSEKLALKLTQEGRFVFLTSLLHQGQLRPLLATLDSLQKQKDARLALKHMQPIPLRLLIMGIPNVGKSTLINRLAKKRMVASENRAGSTRGVQWVQLDKGWMLLDTPGVLTPRYDTKNIAIQLALIGAMKFSMLPHDELAQYLHYYLSQHQPLALKQYAQPCDTMSELLTSLATKHHMLTQHTLDLNRALEKFLRDFTSGDIAKVTFDENTTFFPS
jgi:ribosome biogenesis GTPase A